MSIFNNSDKLIIKEGKSFNNYDFELLDISKELNTSLHIEPQLFNRFQKDEVFSMMHESRIIDALKSRGYSDFFLELESISEFDNRIFIKTISNENLIHLRLKFSDFQLKNSKHQLKMVYIDWLQTQNIKLGHLRKNKILFRGQEYPGLNIHSEITYFIKLLTKKIGAQGVFNIPEYFHDAVLFQRSFQFTNPVFEAEFRILLKTFKDIGLRKLSNLIHTEKIVYIETNKKFLWGHRQMLSFVNEKYSKILFNRNYNKTLKKKLGILNFKILD